MIVDAVTESGRVYRIDIDSGLWTRMTRDGHRDTTERVWGLKVGTLLRTPWDSPETWEDATLPEVGKNLFLTSRDVWYVSTKIVAVNEVPTWDHGLPLDSTE